MNLSYKRNLISVVIPVFNGAHCISDAVRSVLSQTYPNWELIVVDDGSNDITPDIMRVFVHADQRIRFIKRITTIKGAPECRNIGLAASNGDYVVFLDADDILLPHCFEQRLQCMMSQGDLVFGVFLQKIRSRHVPYNDQIFNINCIDRSHLIRLFMELRIPWQTSAPIWKTSFIKSLGGFNAFYKRMEDPDLHLRALIATGNFACFYHFLPDSLYSLQYWSAESVKSNADMFVSDLKLLYQSICTNKELLKLIERKQIRRFLKKGLLYSLRYYMMRDYSRYRSSFKSILSQMKRSGLVSYGFYWQATVFDFINFRMREIKLISSPINRLLFYGISKYSIYS